MLNIILIYRSTSTVRCAYEISNFQKYPINQDIFTRLFGFAPLLPNHRFIVQPPNTSYCQIKSVKDSLDRLLRSADIQNVVDLLDERYNRSAAVVLFICDNFAAVTAETPEKNGVYKDIPIRLNPNEKIEFDWKNLREKTLFEQHVFVFLEENPIVLQRHASVNASFPLYVIIIRISYIIRVHDILGIQRVPVFLHIGSLCYSGVCTVKTRPMKNPLLPDYFFNNYTFFAS